MFAGDSSSKLQSNNASSMPQSALFPLEFWTTGHCVQSPTSYCAGFHDLTLLTPAVPPFQSAGECALLFPPWYFVALRYVEMGVAGVGGCLAN